MDAPDQRELVAYLLKPESYPHHVAEIRHVETHISHLFLTGEYAYKLKKAVKFDFLDFTTLEQRKHFCEEEVRVNSRYAAELYLDVLPISRVDGQYLLGDASAPVEYLIRMREFDSESLFDRRAEQGTLDEASLLGITDAIARFHESAPRRPEFWSPESVRRAYETTLDELAKLGVSPAVEQQIAAIRSAATARIARDAETMRRRQGSHVRECHGDLHLKNMCSFGGRPLPFDGIEFNPTLSNCDVWADLAFFVMDLQSRTLHEAATAVINQYLQETDDFDGLRLLDLYVSYRAAIRARISALEVGSAATSDERETLLSDSARYLALAASTLEPRRRALIAVGGLAGSGKSTVSNRLAKLLGAVHIRSDAVRKHLLNIRPSARAPVSAYRPEVSDSVYRALLDRAEIALTAGYPVIVDAVYHSPAWRGSVEALAARLRVPFAGFWCDAPAEITVARVRQRTGDISDATDTVVRLQQEYELGDITWTKLDTVRPPEEAAAFARSRVPLA